MDLQSGLKIVSIGGGTGLATLLSGLKHYVGLESESFGVDSLTAVVTVTDDGGSSGRLREEFQILPPGDIRNCIVALAEDEHLLTRLLQYRFESEGALSGHSFGNILLTALTAVTGDFLDAIKLTSEVLAIKGRIFPATVEDVTLEAEIEDGRLITGETRIVQARSRIRRLRLTPARCSPLPETLDAIGEADVITIGPGSLYTSILPNLLVEGIGDAIAQSPASKIYVGNIMTQPGETEGFAVEDHLDVLCEYCPALRFDYLVLNSGAIKPVLREKYLADGAVQVELRTDAHTVSERYNATIVSADLLNDNGVVRHDPAKLADFLLEVYQSEKGLSRKKVLA